MLVLRSLTEERKKSMHHNVREQNLVNLTQLEKEMLDCGISGFLPMGPASFQPNERKQVCKIIFKNMYNYVHACVTIQLILF